VQYSAIHCNTLSHTHEWVMSHTHQGVMSHIGGTCGDDCENRQTYFECLSSVCHADCQVTETFFLFKRAVMSHIRMRDVTHMNESWHTDESVMSHTETTAARTAIAHCNTLQHIATRCNIEPTAAKNAIARCNTLQRTATHCNTLQCTATHCNALQHIAIHCNIEPTAAKKAISAIATVHIKNW